MIFKKTMLKKVQWQWLKTQFSDLASSMNPKQKNKNKNTQTYHSKIKITKLNGKILIWTREKNTILKRMVKIIAVF